MSQTDQDNGSVGARLAHQDIAYDTTLRCRRKNLAGWLVVKHHQHCRHDLFDPLTRIFCPCGILLAAQVIDENMLCELRSVPINHSKTPKLVVCTSEYELACPMRYYYFKSAVLSLTFRGASTCTGRNHAAIPIAAANHHLDCASCRKTIQATL